MRTRTSSRAARAAAVPALLLVLAGCGGGSEPAADAPASTPPSTTAPASPDAAQSPAGDSGDGEPGGLSRTELVAAMKSAVADQKSAHMDMQMSTTGGVISSEGDVSYAGKSTSMRMTMQIPGMSSGGVEMRMVDGVIYMAMPPMTPKGKFLKIDPNDKSNPMAGQFSGLGDQMDPLRSFDAFDTGLKKVDYLGVESVDGEDMGHYVLTVDTAAGMKALGQQVPQGLPKTMTYDVWLDQDDLLRRMQMQLAGISMDMRMSDWGKKVTVTAPPAGALVQVPSNGG